MANRASAPDLIPGPSTTSRWDRDRLEYERRDRDNDRIRERSYPHHHHHHRSGSRRAPPSAYSSSSDTEGDDDDSHYIRLPPRRPSRPVLGGAGGGRDLLREESVAGASDVRRGRRASRQEEEAGYRVPPYVDIPLPRSKALPPPRVYAERERVEEIEVADEGRFVDEEFHRMYPERVREKEIVTTRRRTRSRDSRATSRRGRSRSSRSSSSSSSGGTALTTRSEYPKKGKTRIPARLVSKRALIDLGYPFVEEGNVIIVQKALGQQNIDDLLKLSDDYKKCELEIVAARSSAGDIIEERIEHRTEIYEGAAALAAPTPTAPSPPVDVVKTTVIRDVSPARSHATSFYDTATTASYDTYTTSSTATPLIVDAHPRHARFRPTAPETDELRYEIRALEKQLARRERSRHSRHSHSRHRSLSRGGEMVRAERLSTGELVLYEEEVEQIQEPTRAGTRIEKDKRAQHYLVHLLRKKLVETTESLEHDLKAGSGANGQTTYSQTKFVQLLGAHWWRRQLKDQCAVVAVSPGLVPGTGIGRGAGMKLTMDMPDAKTVPEGAQSILRAFTREDLPEDPEQIFLTSWGEWWSKEVYALTLDKSLQDKWCPSKEEIEREEGLDG
ncbi:hypothetical protein N0V88_007710 [Collariella sp. IMI 366227]|nr:hypothetical protein N0V88_007710 [Collariella sp. IMI 366227]